MQDTFQYLGRVARRVSRILQTRIRFFAYALRQAKSDPYAEFFNTESLIIQKTFRGINDTFITPLPISVSPASPFRVNIIIDTVTDLFGGYIATYNLARKLMQEGHRIRFLISDQKKSNLPREIEQWEGFENFFHQVEVHRCWIDHGALDVSPQDQFIARSWSACHIAHGMLKNLQRSRFIYLAQDFEPIFYCHGSQYALALQAFALPQYTLFSSELLRDYLRRNQVGVFAQPNGDDFSAAFEHPIDTYPTQNFRPTNDRPKKLLFYVRPDTPRNMFELGYLALIEAIRGGGFRDEWEFYGIGARGATRTIDLTQGRKLRIIPRLSLHDYRSRLPQFDLGLCLMLSPHPSLVPLDMAAAGLITVTNTYANKTQEAFQKISGNIIAVAPSIEAIARGLGEAVERVNDLPSRIAGQKLQWARTWDTTFHPAIMEKLRQWIGVEKTGS